MCSTFDNSCSIGNAMNLLTFTFIFSPFNYFVLNQGPLGYGYLNDVCVCFADVYYNERDQEEWHGHAAGGLLRLDPAAGPVSCNPHPQSKL